MVKIAIYVAALTLVAPAALGQSTTWHGVANPTFSSTSTLVIVPTLVRSASGELVTDLDASHFRLTDNGIEQKVSVAEAENQRLAMVVLMQTGGAASSQLWNYSKLDTLLENMLGSSTRKVALVTFDSRPEQIWGFPSRADALYDALTHQEGGDQGAAIMDAVKCAIGELRLQPASFRRIILLLSQAQDDGSEAHTEDMVRSLAESGTTIYSLTFSPKQARVKGHFAKPVNGNPRDQKSLGVVLKAMRENTAAEVAALSGGEHLRFRDERDLETKLSILAKDIHSGYTLSFSPSSHDSGFHAIAVHVVKKHTRLEVVARTIYWFDTPTTEK
jgi:VWFA-related protein